MEFQGEGSDKQWGDLLGAAGTNQLPGDLLMQIVSRLPVKSILRFKSVCRAWYFLFNHPVFIQYHCRIASSFAKMNSTLFYFKREEGRQTLFTLLLDDSCDEPVIKDYDLLVEVDYLALIGSINGLVCLTVNVMGKGESIMFWHPAIRKHSLIPNPRSLSGNGGNVLSGLAYDRKTDIYKVIRVVYSYAEGVAPASVEIYSTGTNIWRTTDIIGFPGNMIWGSSSGVVAEGDLYWLSTNESEGSNLQQLIVSFDASSEALTFHPIPLDGKPYPFDWVYLDSWSFEATGNHPVLMYNKFKDDRYEECIERVTISKLVKSDDGGRALFHIENLTVEPLLELIRIIYIFGNGKIIAEDLNETLIIYDQGDIKDCRDLYQDFHASNLFDYTESLVWPSTLA